MTRIRWFHGVASVIVASALAAGAWAWVHRPAERSAVVGEPWPEMEDLAWNKANLDGAVVIIPDRPHDRAEADAHRGGNATIHRVRRFKVSTSSVRLRMPELAAKVPGRTRIAAVGDSVTFGWGVRPEEGWVSLLEAELRRRGHDVEVLNAGSPGSPVASMTAWCRTQAASLAVDRVIWMRRAPPPDQGGVPAYASGVRACEVASAAPPLVLLPPVSRFDLHGLRAGSREAPAIAAQLGPAYVVRDLTDAFRAAQGNRGESLVMEGSKASVVDLETGTVWLTTSRGGDGRLPAAVGQLFETEPEVAEALIFDGGHPDVEGNAVMAALIADLIEPTL